jgi:CHASE3 domain sensor protein
MTHDEARRIARDPSADPFDKYDARKVLSEPEPSPEPERQRKRDTTRREPDWSAWNRWCDLRIRAALTEQRKFLLAVVAEALGEHVAQERKAVKRELADELRRLRIELAETQTTISELRSVLAAERGPIDMPSPLRARLN